MQPGSGRLCKKIRLGPCQSARHRCTGEHLQIEPCLWINEHICAWTVDASNDDGCTWGLQWLVTAPPHPPACTPCPVPEPVQGRLSGSGQQQLPVTGPGCRGRCAWQHQQWHTLFSWGQPEWRQLQASTHGERGQHQCTTTSPSPHSVPSLINTLCAAAQGHNP
jgi:hypothetical protein